MPIVLSFKPYVMLITTYIVTVQELGGCGSLLWSLDKAPTDKVNKLGTPSVAVFEGWRRLGGDHEDCSHGVNVTVGRLTLSHLQGGDAQTPDILNPERDSERH